MASTVALSVLRTRAKQKADFENSDFISDSEWTTMLNASATWLYDLLVKAYGEDYFLTTKDFTTDGSANYTFAGMSLTDFYKLRGVSLVPATGEELPLRRFTFRDRGRANSGYSTSRLGKTALRYRLRQNSIDFSPTPDSGLTIRLWYVPHMTLMVGESTTIDGINGWEEFVIIDAAIKAKDKEESDVTVLMQERQVFLDRLETMAEERDIGEPEKVTDVQRDYEFGEFMDGIEY